MIPRSVPVMAKRLTVSFGLSGPVTQPTSDVPGGAAGAGAGGGAWNLSGVRDWLTGRAGGVGEGITSACCCTRASVEKAS